MKILAISGSSRKESTNTALLQATKEHAPEGVEIQLLGDLTALPIFSPDSEGESTPLEVIEFVKAISDAEGIIISSPEYIRAIPGGLKNALDWMVSRFEIIDKPIAIVHASHRGDDLLDSLRLVLSTVSKNFFEDIFVRFELINKTPKEVRELFENPTNQAQLTRFVIDFVKRAKAVSA